MTRHASLVSVIMPAWNEAASISTSIESVLSQSYSKLELLVIDNQSTDDTAEIVQRYAYQDYRVRLLSSQENGVSSARNQGLKHAQGDFISFLDADDKYLPGSIERRVAALETHPSWSGVYGIAEIVDEHFNRLGWQLGVLSSITFKDLYRCPIHINALMGRSELLQSEHFDKNLTNGEDWLYLSRLLRQGKTFYSINLPVVTYRLHTRSTTQRKFVDHQKALTHVIETIYGEDAACTAPIPQYRQGLSTPPMSVTLLHRQIQMLTWMLLSDDTQEAAQLVADMQKTGPWDQISFIEILNDIQFTVCRYYHCHINHWLKHLRLQQESLHSTMVILNLAHHVPDYTQCLKRALDDKYLGQKLQIVRKLRTHIPLSLRQYQRLRRLFRRRISH